MNLPQLDLADLPVLPGAPGIHGSRCDASPQWKTIDDSVVIMMVYLYDVLPKN